MIYHFLYISERSNQFNDAKDLELILERSRLKNSAKNLTGLLIKNGQFFIQVLEGKKEDVMAIFKVIEQDLRHTNIRMIMDYTSQGRIFPEWSMGLIDSADHETKISNLLPLLLDKIISLEAKDKVISILRRFNGLT